LNEWLWADLRSEDDTARRAALAVVLALQERNDAFVVVRGSPFARKLWQYCDAANDASAPIEMKSAARILTLLRYDPKCIELPEATLPELPPEVAGHNADDHYLLRAYLAIDDGLIVTTDASLLALLASVGWRGVHRDDWLRAYL
jgi:hypothetical protein